MTPLQVEWHPAGERALLSIANWRTAETIARAVHALATTGAGDVENVGGAMHVLIVAGYRVVFSVDVNERTLLVWYVSRIK